MSDSENVDTRSPVPASHPARDVAHPGEAVAGDDRSPAAVDDRLMQRLQGGDGAALDELVARHQSALIAFFYSNTRDRALAEDLSQETLLRVYDQAWDYLPTGKFSAWLFRIARNLLIDNVRRRSHDALLQAGQQTPLDQSLAEVASHAAPGPLDQAGTREVARAVDELLRELPEEQRLTFTLYHFAGLALPEIADILETNLPTTKGRLRLAREKLSTELRRRGWKPPDNAYADVDREAP